MRLSRSLLAWLLVSLSLLAQAQSGAGVAAPGTEDWKSIRTTVSLQLAAFQRDDATAAYDLASPAVRRQFRSAREFLRMVREDYAPVYRPRAVRFLEPYVVGAQPVQPVELISRDEETLTAFFIMERQPDGSWKVAGCALDDTGTVSV